LREHDRENAIEAEEWAAVWKAERAVEPPDRPTSDRVDIGGFTAPPHCSIFIIFKNLLKAPLFPRSSS
jgi:hypothetical protein